MPCRYAAADMRYALFFIEAIRYIYAYARYAAYATLAAITLLMPPLRYAMLHAHRHVLFTTVAYVADAYDMMPVFFDA